MKKLKRFIKLHYKKIIVPIFVMLLLFSFNVQSFSAISNLYTEKMTRKQMYEKVGANGYGSYVLVHYESGATKSYGMTSWVSNAYGYSYYARADVDVDGSDRIVGFDYYFVCRRNSETDISNAFFKQLYKTVHSKAEFVLDCNLWSEKRGDYSRVNLDSIEFICYKNYNPALPNAENLVFDDLGDKYQTIGRPQKHIYFDEYFNLGNSIVGGVLEIEFKFSVLDPAVYKPWSDGSTTSQLCLALLSDWEMSSGDASNFPQYEKPDTSTLNDALEIEGDLLDSVGGDLDKLADSFDEFGKGILANRLFYNSVRGVGAVLDKLYDVDVVGFLINFSMILGMAAFVLNLGGFVISLFSSHNKDDGKKVQGKGSSSTSNTVKRNKGD